MRLQYTLLASLLLLTPTLHAEEVATINGDSISRAQIEHFISKQKKPIPFEQGVNEVINLELLAKAAETAKFTEEPEMALELDRVRTAVLASAWLKKYVADLNIGEAELRQVYQTEVLDKAAPTEYKARHILVETEDEAKDLIKKLDDGGDFVALAKEFSTGPSGPRGGDLGWFAKESMVAPFAEATASMEKGQYSKTPVKTRFGYHVILLEDTRQKEPASFDDMKQKIASAIAAQKVGQYLEQLHQEAEVKLIKP